MNSQDARQEIRRALLADPRRTSPAIEAAIADDPSLAALRRQLIDGAGQMATAFADVAPPAGLAERVILRVRYRRRSTWLAGMAASVVLAAVLLVVLRPDAPVPIAMAMLDHVIEETAEWADDGGVSAQTATASLGQLGVGFRDAGYRIRHLAECVVAGRTGRHLVLNTPQGLVSFLILPTLNGEVGRRQQMNKGAMQAVFVANAQPGARASQAVTIGVFAEQGVDPKSMEALLQQMFPAAAGEA